MSISSTKDNAVDAIKDLLEQTTDTDYRDAKPPVIERVWERTPQDRLNTSQDAVYIWQPVDGDIERVSADGDLLFRESTVEVWVYVLEDQSKAVRIREDLIQFFANYIDDNKENTQFNDVMPVNDMDERPGNLPRDTSHSVAGLTLDLNKRQSVA